MKTQKTNFDIYIPATENRDPIKVKTIEIEVLVDEQGNELITPESREQIQKQQARFMGLLAPIDIVELRKKLKLSQLQFAELIGCGKKSLSRWENGREHPTKLVNTILRLLEDDRIRPHDLQEVRKPKQSESKKVIQFISDRKDPPQTYKYKWFKSFRPNGNGNNLEAQLA